MKITVIGGGSSSTPALINGFIERVDSLPVTELWLMDISQERLDVVGSFAQRMVAHKGSPFAVHLTTDQREAVRDTSYVITQLRVGGMQARRGDEYLGRRHGLIGQETTGVGGMAKALRTVPVVLGVAADMREVAPGALLVNFANPSGLVTQALSTYVSDVASVGVCNSAIGVKMWILKEMEEQLGQAIAPERARLDTLGLNHLTWYRGFTVDGKDVWGQVMSAYLDRLRKATDPEWDPSLIETLGMIPNGYLHYYYHTDRKLADQEKWPPSRAEQVMEIEKDLLAQYAEPDRVEPPEGLMKRGGAYYSTVATQILNAHHNDLGEVHIVNVPHRGAVPGWPEGWVLEMPCAVHRDGIAPLPADPLPPVCFGLMANVKMYEVLTAAAAVDCDARAAYEALLAHPLGPPAHQVQAVLDDMLETNRAYLPKLWG